MTPTRINIAGVLVDNISKHEALQKIKNSISSGQSRYVVTTYSEFVVFAQRDEEYRKILNQALLSLPDGVGILWAAKFLSQPFSAGILLMDAFRLFIRVIYSGMLIVLKPKYIRTVIAERITGSAFIFDLCALAEQLGYSVSLVGGTDKVAEKSAAKLQQIFPRLQINLALSDCRFDDNLIELIGRSKTDLLFIAYSPPEQEKWLANNLEDLNISMGIGLGGTFDYLAGKRPLAPRFLRVTGLEWLWRLLTQPWRWRRMWNAIAVFVWVVYKFKLKQAERK